MQRSSNSSQYGESRDRGRFHDLKQIDDEAFAYADRREKEEKKNQISISAMHGSVEEIEADKKRKQRVATTGAGQTNQSRKLADMTKLSKEVNARGAKSGILNSTQSAGLTRELESMFSE